MVVKAIHRKVINQTSENIQHWYTVFQRAGKTNEFQYTKASKEQEDSKRIQTYSSHWNRFQTPNFFWSATQLALSASARWCLGTEEASRVDSER